MALGITFTDKTNQSKKGGIDEHKRNFKKYLS